MQSKEKLMAALDEQNDVGSALSKAWRAEHAQDSQNFMVGTNHHTLFWTGSVHAYKIYGF